MKFTFKKFNSAITALRYDFNTYAGESAWEDASIDIDVSSEDIEAGKLIDCMVITVESTCKVSNSNNVKHITRRLEIFPDSENRLPRLTKSETRDVEND